MFCPLRYLEVTSLFTTAIRTLVVMGQPHNLDKADYSSAIMTYQYWEPMRAAETMNSGGL
jgi:hypothetical protein